MTRAATRPTERNTMADTVHNEHPGLLHAWHPVALSAEVTDQPVRVLLLGQPWVLGSTPTARSRTRCSTTR